jgi:hypothetical protein
LAWKKKKLQDKKDSDAKEEEKKRNDYKSGKQNGLSGRDMFRYDHMLQLLLFVNYIHLLIILIAFLSFNPELANDGNMEDGDEVFDSYNREEDGEDVQEYKELDLNLLTLEALEVKTDV